MIRIRPIALILVVAALAVQASVQAMTPSQGRVMREIRHELVTLPYYGVFDWLEGEVRPDGTVVLRGEVTRPSTKKEAEARLKSIEGIDRVVNEIDVLPPSPQDDRLRVALYRALFNWDSPLFRYATHQCRRSTLS